MAQKTAGNRRFSQKTADFRRKPQIFAETGFSHLLGSVFGRTDFPRIYIFGSPDFFADFLAGLFLLIFVGEKVPRKILQENPRQNPPKFLQQESPTHFCRGSGPTLAVSLLARSYLRLLATTVLQMRFSGSQVVGACPSAVTANCCQMSHAALGSSP